MEAIHLSIGANKFVLVRDGQRCWVAPLLCHPALTWTEGYKVRDGMKPQAAESVQTRQQGSTPQSPPASCSLPCSHPRQLNCVPSSLEKCACCPCLPHCGTCARCRGRRSGGRWLTTCSPPSKTWKPTSTTSVVGPLARLAPAPLHPTFMYVVCTIPFARWGPGEGSGWSSLRAPKFKNVELPGAAADISAVGINLPQSFS